MGQVVKNPLGNLNAYFTKHKHLPSRLARRWIIPPAIWEKIEVMRSDAPVETQQVSSSNISLWELRRAPSESVLWIPIELIRSQTGIAYTPQQHHGVRFLEEGIDALRRFYKLHTPKTSLEANFVFGSNENERAPDLWAGKPWGKKWNRRAWRTGHQAWGPVSEVFLRAEANRYDKIRSSILRLGFIDKYQGGDPIRFQVLIDDHAHRNQFRILAVSGKHRVAVLAHLGWKYIPMHPVASPDREIRRSDVLDWPGVSGALYSRDQAELYFLSFFRDAYSELLPDW